MVTTVVGGAMLPHAPQFFTMPPTEDRANVDRVRAVATRIGSKLRELKPDLWIIFSNDHAEQFFHSVAPPFTIHVGGSANGHFAGHDFHWDIPSPIGFELVRQLYKQGFDPAFTSTAKFDYAMGIPLTHIGHTDPILPIYVNAYLAPQPTMARCYAFGEAIARAVTTLGLKTVVLASGGMSHFPGTNRYSNPELEWDQAALARIAAGNLKSLIGYDEGELDAAAQLGKHLAGIEQVIGIEGAFDAHLLVEVDLGELLAHHVSLLDADPVLAGQHSAHPHAEPEDVGAEKFGAM